MFRRIISTISLATSFALPGAAQGRTDYVNFESPVTKPVAIARIGPGSSSVDDPYLLVCNTPDNRVEVYDLSDPDAPALQERILVGLEPVSVVYYEFGNGRQMMYTANWLGDSVTIVELFSTDHELDYKMIGTFPVSHSSAIDSDSDLAQPQRFGDEPVHLAVVDGGSLGQHLFVAKRSGSSISWLNPFTGVPKFHPNGLGSSANDEGIDLVLTSDGIFARHLDGSFATTPTGDFAVKQPQMVLTVPHPASSTAPIWVLSHSGGGSELTHGADFNLDLWSMNLLDDLTPASPPGDVVRLPETSASPGTLGLQLGTTNFSMEFDPNENPTATLYAVGAEARNSVVGNAALRVLDTGFVRTVLYKVDVSDPDNMTVLRRDLNTRSTGPAIANATRAIVQATDVAYYEDDKVCLVGFGSDTFALVDTSSSNPLAWTITRAAVPRLEPTELEVAGPRGLAVDATTDHAYVLNSIDNSLVVVDLATSPLTLSVQPLNDMDASGVTDHDPVPEYIRRGRKFLYSNLGSGRPTNSGIPGFVACASCHVDGRLDNLPWRLTPPATAISTQTAAGDPLGVFNRFGFELNLEFKPPLTTNFDFAAFLTSVLPTSGFPSTGGVSGNAKAPKITQSLQGLMNYELETSEGFGDGATLYHRFSNAPYHWRGDQATFREFNAAFGDLQNGFTNLTETQLTEYVEFINSIHYPPSSEEPLVREYSGALDTADTAGNAKRGFSQFMDLEIIGSTFSPESGFGGRSCSQCHELPFGGNNRWTTGQRAIPGYDDDTGNLDDDNIQPLDTPALRGLRQKEQRLELDNLAPSGLTLQCNEFGLAHEGLRAISINDFVANAPRHTSTDVEDMTAFVRQLDHGIAPIVGRAVTVTLDDVSSGNLAAGWKKELVEEMETQAGLANCGLSVHLYDATSNSHSELVKGFWYVVGVAEYREEGTASTDSSRADLIAMLSDNTALRKDTLVFTATPLGSERRVASLSGSATHPDNSSPAAPDLIGTTPNTSNLIVLDSAFPSTTDSNGGLLTWTNSSPFVFPDKQRVMEHFRAQCMALGQVPSSIVHDAPRRLRFTGPDFREGGKILFGIPLVEPDASPVDGEFVFLTLPIYPTEAEHEEQQVWETNVEFEPFFLYMLLLGGPNAPDVIDTLAGNSPTFDSGDVDTWNQYRIRYVSPNVDAEPGEVSTSVLVPLLY